MNNNVVDDKRYERCHYCNNKGDLSFAEKQIFYHAKIDLIIVMQR
jgi:molybdenum cofactor biosynthesis enzyme MoaA